MRMGLLVCLANCSEAIQAQVPLPYPSAPDVSIPLDSWIYPAADKLSSLGHLGTVYLGLRPWTKRALREAIMSDDHSASSLSEDEDEDALELSSALLNAILEHNEGSPVSCPKCTLAVDSVYSRSEQIVGPPLTQEFYVGETITNDYGRRIGQGFQELLGGSFHASARIFTLQVRAEFQHLAPQQTMPQQLAAFESNINSLPYVVPAPIPSLNKTTLLMATISAHVLGNDLSLGKGDRWWGPASGGAMLWSNNAEPIYEFRIKRNTPLRIPFVSKVLGPVQWDAFLGDLKGHVYPNKPWIQGQKISLHPTKRLELGFSRTVEFGGAGRGGLTVRSFWHSFASVGDKANSGSVQFDVGDRRGGFDFRYVFPGLTLYADSFCDDDPSPLANLKRSAWRPGFYVPRLPGLHRFDLRFEAPYTNMPENQTFPTPGVNYRNLNYHDGYTNNGRLLADWIGPDSTGYQAWSGFAVNPRDRIAVDWRMAKLDRAFIPQGGTQQVFGVSLVKHTLTGLEVSARVQSEQWTVSFLSSGTHHDTAALLQLTWHPTL